MKEFYKKPVFYYILVPLVVAVWPLLVWGLYLPRAREALSSELKSAKRGQAMALEILQLDPGRLNFAGDPNKAGEEFSYATAVNKVAGLCGIPASKYKLHTGPIIKKGKQRTQDAHLTLDKVSIVSFAKFLSLIQLRWNNLQCDTVKLNKVEVKGEPDLWTIDIDFKYYY